MNPDSLDQLVRMVLGAAPGDRWLWDGIHALLLLTALLIPLTFQLLNFVTEQMIDVEDRKTPAWIRDEMARRLKQRVKGFYIFSDPLSTDTSLNSLFLLIATMERGTDPSTHPHVWQSVGTHGFGVIVIVLMLKLAIHFLSGWLVGGARSENLSVILVASSVKSRGWAAMLLLLGVFFSPFVMLCEPSSSNAGQSFEILPIACAIGVYLFTWLMLTVIWTPVSAVQMLRDHQGKVSDLERQQMFSFGANAGGYEDDDAYRSDNIELITKHLLGAKTGSATEPQVAVLYAGCGAGSLLVKLAKALEPRTAGGRRFVITALDASSNMLGEAAAKIRKEGLQFGNGVEVVLSLGDPLHPDLQRSMGGRQRYDAILCLNNTLGNLIRRDIASASACRNGAVAYFHRALRPGGRLFLSVYASDLPLEIDPNRYMEERYSKSLTLVPALSSPGSGDFIMELRGGKGREPEDSSFLFSHWFTRGELLELLTSNGFHPTSVTVDTVKTGDARFTGDSFRYHVLMACADR